MLLMSSIACRPGWSLVLLRAFWMKSVCHFQASSEFFFFFKIGDVFDDRQVLKSVLRWKLVNLPCQFSMLEMTRGHITLT